MINTVLIIIALILTIWLPKIIKKTILIIVALSAGLVVITVIGVAIFLASLPSDILPFDDSHLIRPVESIPAEQNALTYYTKAIEAIIEPEEGTKLEAIFYDEKNITWDDKLVKEFLDQNSAVFKFIAEGNRCEMCLPPHIISLGANDPLYHDSPKSDCSWYTVDRLFSLQIKDNIIHSKPKEALSNTIARIKSFKLIQATPSCLMNYLYITGSQEIYLKNIQDLIQSRLLNDEQFVELKSIFEQSAPSTNAYTLARKSEYEIFRNLIDDLYSGKMDTNKLLDPWGESSISIPNWTSKYFLHPNRTKQEIGTIYADLISKATNTYADTKVSNIDKWLESKRLPFDEAEGIHKFLEPNFYGFLLYNLMHPSGLIVERRCRLMANHNAILILIALQRYKNTNKTFPTQLEQLVPKFLLTIPIDPFDGINPCVIRKRKELFTR